MFISRNSPLIPGIWTVAPTSTMVRLRLQSSATESSCPAKRGTKEVKPGTKQGQPGTRQGQPGTKQGQPGTKQGQPGTKKRDSGIIWYHPAFIFMLFSIWLFFYSIELYWVCWHQQDWKSFVDKKYICKTLGKDWYPRALLGPRFMESCFLISLSMHYRLKSWKKAGRMEGW